MWGKEMNLVRDKSLDDTILGAKADESSIRFTACTDHTTESICVALFSHDTLRIKL